MSNPTYKRKLASPYWQRRRLEIMERDKFSCRFCGDKEHELHIHHVAYLPNLDPQDYQDEHLLTLCHACHEGEEKLKSEDAFMMGKFLVCGLSRRQLYALSTELRRHLWSPGQTRQNKFQDLMEYLANC
jgi:hypothetical protein